MKPHGADVVAVDRPLFRFGKDTLGHGDWSIHKMDGGVSKHHTKRDWQQTVAELRFLSGVVYNMLLWLPNSRWIAVPGMNLVSGYQLSIDNQS